MKIIHSFVRAVAMSAEAMKWWNRIKFGQVLNLNSNDYRVMDVLAYQHHMNDESKMVFTKSDLARFCNMGRRSLTRSVKNLERHGWIELDKKRPGYAKYYSIPRFEAWLRREEGLTETPF